MIENKPVKKLGLWMNTSLVIGAGIFLMPVALSAYGVSAFLVGFLLLLAGIPFYNWMK